MSHDNHALPWTCPTSLFTSGTDLSITFCSMDGTELTNIMSKQCPGLKHLRLLVHLVRGSDVSIHSDSLKFVVIQCPKRAARCMYQLAQGAGKPLIHIRYTVQVLNQSVPLHGGFFIAGYYKHIFESQIVYS